MRATNLDLVFCWCGHSGDTRETEKGDHFFDEVSNDASTSFVLRCATCEESEADARNVWAFPRRAGALKCRACSHGTI